MLETFITSLPNGIVYGLLLFLLASGLTLIYSMMGVLNFAHAAFYMLGAYFAYSISVHIGYWPGFIIAPILVGILGALVERYALRYIHQFGHVPELIFTFALFFFIEEIVKFVWGDDHKPYKIPESLEGTFMTVYDQNFTNYRMFMLTVSVAIFVGLALVLARTRIGLIIQAAIDKPRVVNMLGHNVPLIFMVTFGVGSALAGIAGVIAGPILATSPAMGVELGAIIFAVVVFGGLGSLSGAFVASLMMGILLTFAQSSDLSLAGALSVEDLSAMIGFQIESGTFLYELWTVKLPRVAPLIPFLMLVLILIFRPTGLMGKREG